MTTTTTTIESRKRMPEHNEDFEAHVISNDNCETLPPNQKKKKKRTRKRKHGVNNDDNDGDTKDDNDAVAIMEGEDRVVVPPKDAETPNDNNNSDDDDTELDRTVYMEGIPFAATYEQILHFLTRVVVVVENDDPAAAAAAATTTATTNKKPPPPPPSSTTHPTNHQVPRPRTHIRREEILDVRLATWQDTGRYRGYGHVVYATREARQFAIQHYHHQYFYNHDSNNDGSNTNDSNNNDNSSSNHNKPNKNNNRYISMTAAVTPRGGSGNTTTIPQSAPSPTIILRNLSYHATEADIHEALTRLLLLLVPETNQKKKKKETIGKNDGPDNDLSSSSNHNNNITVPTVESGNIRVVRHSIPPYHSKGLAYITFDSIEDATYCMNRILQQPTANATSSSTSSSSSSLVIHQRPVVVDYDHGRIRGSFRTAQHTFWSTTHRGNQPNNSSSSNSTRRK